MLRPLFFILIAFSVSSVNGYSRICENETAKTLSCTTQILGEESTNSDLCKMDIYPANSPVCSAMSFTDIAPNTHIGGVTLKPYILTRIHNDKANPFAINHTVLNITFNNIKWKTMKFRFQDKSGNTRNHCRNIQLSNDITIDEHSVLYYDCYWLTTDGKDGQNHILDFEATSEGTVNRGQYYFNIPSTEMLSQAVRDEDWKPFMYIEIFIRHMRLHIVPPPDHLRINAYNIKVMKECSPTHCVVKSKVINLKNRTDEVTYDYDFLGENGKYYFVVTPLHEKCFTNETKCKIVESPKISISSEYQRLNICIASITTLIVAALFAYYIALRVIRKYWCKDYKPVNEIPAPTKILVIYSPTNSLHAKCVASFVTYLRSEYGLDVRYDGDISSTPLRDPYIWAEESFRLASHVMYIVGPENDVNEVYHDKPILTAHKDVDKLLLSFVKGNRRSPCPKHVMNVFFEYSNGPIPEETRQEHMFTLLKDWQKLIAYLSKNLLPKVQIMRTEKGKSFLADLTRAKKLLTESKDEIIVRCDKINASDKKILL